MNWIIDAGKEDVRFKALRQSETIDRPIGNDDFLRQEIKCTVTEMCLSPKCVTEMCHRNGT